MALPSTREFLPPSRRVPFFRHGVVMRVVPGNHIVPVEIERAPDSGGSPGTYVKIATLVGLPLNGANYIDLRPSNGATWWYRCRHGKGTLYGNDGAYFTAFSAVARVLTDDDFRGTGSASSPFTRTDDILALAVSTGKIAASAVTPPKAEGRSRCKVKFTADTNVGSGITSTISWNTETGGFDVGSLHDTSTNPERVTVPTGGDTGVWMVHAHVAFKKAATGIDNGTGYRYVDVQLNGSIINGTRIDSATSWLTIVDVIGFLNAPTVGQYFTVQVLHNGGETLQIDAAESYFEVIHLW